MSRFRSGFAAAVGLFLATVGSAAQPQIIDTSLEPIRKDIFFLAGPECEGRGIDTKGINKAADYIAAAFKSAGLKPGMPNGSYFQPFDVTLGAKLGSPNKLLFRGLKGKTFDLEIPKEASPLGYSQTGTASGGLVFAGYGITAPKLKYDDYAGLNVEGKIVIVIRKLPKPAEGAKGRFDTTVPENEDSPLGALQTKIENASAHKAAGILFVSDRVTASRSDDVMPYAMHAQGTEPSLFPVFHVAREQIDSLFKSAGKPPLEEIEEEIDKDLKPHSFALKGWAADAEITVIRSEVKCKNVVGVLDGRGPLANETVVIGAHYDHLGYGTYGSLGGKDSGGKIHYGADDNGSGTAGLIELARRFGAMNNREGRRIVFIAFSGEERGLYGSIHYCKEPLFPLDSTVAMLNMDMIGRVIQVPADWLGLWPGKRDRLVIYGTGTGDSLDKLVDDANGQFDFKLFKIPGGSAPSDSDSFYRKKVPVLFFFSGTHGDYHKPTDSPDKINLAGLKKVADMTAYFIDRLSIDPAPKFQVTRGGWEDPTETRPRTARGGPKMGIMPGNYEERDSGVLVGGVSPGGAAEAAGLQEGDLIVEIAGKPIKNIGGYMTVMAGQKAGQAVAVKIKRKGKEVTVEVTPK